MRDRIGRSHPIPFIIHHSTRPIHTLTPVHPAPLVSRCTRQYQNVDRTFRDVDAVLVAYAGILPKMDNFTHDNGQKQLLFCLYGTIPISFRGSTYNIPIAVWLPYSYPRHPPFCFVTPTATMLVRQGKHVDLSGKVYHPLLSTWHTRPDDVSLMQLLGVMQTIFTNEPPVYSKPAAPPGGSQPRNSPHPQGGSATPPPPPYPPS
ncbi:UEV domain-containing protein, partial [Zopfochytrium polystomum]